MRRSIRALGVVAASGVSVILLAGTAHAATLSAPAPAVPSVTATASTGLPGLPGLPGTVAQPTIDPVIVTPC
jgi:hypothetical protein